MSVSGSAEDRRIRALRPPKPPLDPFAPPRTLWERERRGGRVEQSLTVFLTGAECPFTCVFCDLWRHTVEGPTPPGALPAQLTQAFSTPQTGPDSVDRIKLYNASNWFDPRAVPPSDMERVGGLVARYAAVTVESHARMLGPRCEEFAGLLTGRLEVAIGLETVHPRALGRLNKGMTLQDFDQAAAWLRQRDHDLRVFVLVGAPFVSPSETVSWTVRTAEYALERGAAIVSLIPVRPGPGELRRLEDRREFVAPTLDLLEETLGECLAMGMDRVTADLWDAGTLPACAACGPARHARLAAMNLTGRIAAPLHCSACAAGA